MWMGGTASETQRECCGGDFPGFSPLRDFPYFFGEGGGAISMVKQRPNTPLVFPFLKSRASVVKEKYENVNAYIS
jgi:hypothetical protein